MNSELDPKRRLMAKYAIIYIVLTHIVDILYTVKKTFMKRVLGSDELVEILWSQARK